MGYSRWGHKESDMTERLTLSLSCGKTLGSWFPADERLAPGT